MITTITEGRVLEGYGNLEPLPTTDYRYQPYLMKAEYLTKYGSNFGKGPLHRNPIPDGKLFFRGGILDYYQMCYNTHRGVVIRPEHLWHIVLYELATVVAGDPEQYRNLFTVSKDKTTISIPGDSGHIDLDVLVQYLKVLVPTEISTFIPNIELSKTSYLALCGAFCDLVSPYYSYMTFACGFPRIRIEGSAKDWQVLQDCASKIGKLMPEAKAYTDRVSQTLSLVATGGYDALAPMFSDKREGSGSYLHMTGWLKDLFVNNKPRRVQHFPNVISKVHWNHEERDFYNMYIGVFGGQDTGDYVEPEFHFFVEDVTKR